MINPIVVFYCEKKPQHFLLTTVMKKTYRLEAQIVSV